MGLPLKSSRRAFSVAALLEGGKDDASVFRLSDSMNGAVVGVVSEIDRGRGRGRSREPSKVKAKLMVARAGPRAKREAARENHVRWPHGCPQ